MAIVRGLCDKCDKKEGCSGPCEALEKALRKDNPGVMEKKKGNQVVIYPKTQEVHFSDLDEVQLDSFSTEDVVPWRTAELRLRKTTVFVERFFNKVPCKVLADRFGVKENTIVCIYAQAVEQLERIIETLDARKEGIKAMKPEKFTEDQKFFLLCCVFGFTQTEVAKMFRRNRDTVNHKVKRLADQYGAAFAAAAG